jgi:hypothetical protein
LALIREVIMPRGRKPGSKNKIKDESLKKPAPTEDGYWSGGQTKKDIEMLLTSKGAEKISFQESTTPNGMVVNFSWKGLDHHAECSAFRESTLNLRQIYFGLKKCMDLVDMGVKVSVGGL